MEARLDPLEKRLFVNAYGGKVAVIDIEKRQEVGTFSAGRGGVKFGMLLAAAASDTLQSMQFPNQPAPMTSLTEIKTLAFAPSGRFVFVYNSLSGDISVVNTETLTVLDKEATGTIDQAQFMWQTPDGLHLLMSGEKRFLVFDTETGKVVGRSEVKDGHARYLPEFGRLLTTTAEKTTVIEPVTLKPIADLPAAVDAVFVPEHRQFALVSPQSITMYDFDLAPHAIVQGQFRSNQVFSSLFHTLNPGQ